MARNTPESPLIGERYKPGCAWRLYRIFDFRKGHSRRKLLSNGQHNTDAGSGTLDISHDLPFKYDEKYTSGDSKRKRTYGCKSFSSVPYDSANVRKKDFPVDEKKAKRAIVCQKLIDANYQAIDQASNQSKDLVNALQILYSNKELFVDILHDPNSLLVKETHGSQDSQSKRMRRKKLMRSNFEVRLPELERNRINDPKEFSKSIASCSSKLRCRAKSSEEIVMLKPGQGRGQTFEEKMCHLSSQDSVSKLSYKENTAEESNFSFAQMKRQFKDVGGRRRREELRLKASNDESETCSCHFLENSKRVRSRDVLHFDRSSLYLAKSKKMFDVKDFEAPIGHGVPSSKRVLPGNSKFSFVRDIEQTDIELHGEANKHNTEHLYPRNEANEESTCAQKKTNISPDYEWSTGSFRGLGRVVANMRYSPRYSSRTFAACRRELKGETELECFDPMRQNMDDLSWANVKNQNFRFEEFEEDIDLTGDPLADKLRRDRWSSVGHSTTTITNNSMNAEGAKGLDVPSIPRTCNQSHRWTAKSSDTAQKIKGVADFVESPSGIQSSSTPRAEYSGSIRDRAEQKDEEDQQLLNEDVTRPPSSRGVLFDYVKASLQPSNLNWDEFFKFQSADQILCTSLFNELQGLDNQFCGNRRILFDYMNEVLVEVFQYCFSYSPCVSTRYLRVEMLMEERSLLLELKKRVEWFFLQQQPSPRTLEQRVEKDLAECKWWLSKYTDMESIGTEIEGDLLEDAIIEIVSEMLV